MPVEPGLSAEVVRVVSDQDTAIALGSGTVPVLATPRVIALCEEASCLAVAAKLEQGFTTVGMRVQLDHVAPTPVGSQVRAEAYLDKVEGRRLTFRVSVNDERGLIAVGRVTRVIVEVADFLDKAR